MTDVMSTKKFQEEFWNWFDSLHSKDKKKFWEYPLDFACIYFYNKVYSRVMR